VSLDVLSIEVAEMCHKSANYPMTRDISKTLGIHLWRWELRVRPERYASSWFA
jgi:hypothetical protein